MLKFEPYLEVAIMITANFVLLFSRTMLSTYSDEDVQLQILDNTKLKLSLSC